MEHPALHLQHKEGGVYSRWKSTCKGFLGTQRYEKESQRYQTKWAGGKREPYYLVQEMKAEFSRSDVSSLPYLQVKSILTGTSPKSIILQHCEAQRSARRTFLRFPVLQDPSTAAALGEAIIGRAALRVGGKDSVGRAV